MKMRKLPPLILVVDDDRTITAIIETMLISGGYRVITAMNGKMAKETIAANHAELDAILLDRIMPDIDGIEVIKWINNNSNITKTPIIMLTALDKPEQVKEGIDEGVFYYLTKPIQETILKSVVLSAVKESKQQKLLAQELDRHRGGFKLIKNALFSFHSLDEAEDLSCFIANFFPAPNKVLAGISSLLVNAVEHGNFEIFYDEKSKLIAEGTWKQEILRRSALEENKNKFVEVAFNKEGEKYLLKITDQGKGFAWQKFVIADPARALDNHGRGIARANMLFDSLEYNKQGNQVIGVIDKTNKENLVW